MTARTITALLFIAFALAEARWSIHKRDVTSICTADYNSPSKILCYCVKDVQHPEIVKSADCYLTAENVKPNDHATWDLLGNLKSTTKLSITNSRGIALKYIPTHALKHFEELLEIDIRHGNIEKIHPYAFANQSTVEEISLRESQIKILEKHAFAHHRSLAEIKLDENNIVEINRDVFLDLPSLEKLFLTGNQITTIHDKAFMHLNNLKELELNMNKLFSLNSETFSGLRRLLKLDLSSNNLEVIGDNTFLPLSSLESLNLEGNKIQMLDDKAFHGLRNLKSLSLAHNKLAALESDKVFMSLESLKSLSLRANELRELKSNVMAPLIQNLYEADSHFDVEDNLFPCDCRLDWFLNIMNRTQSKNLKITMENIKCIPDASLKEKWNNLEESEKNSGQLSDVDEMQADYEYYDESQLNGKLFYIDIRDLINCEDKQYFKLKDSPGNNPIQKTPKQNKATALAITTSGTTNSPRSTMSSRISTTFVGRTSPTPAFQPEHVPHISPTPAYFYPETRRVTVNIPDFKDDYENEIGHEKKPDLYTTNRLVTVSAKPIAKASVYEDMAADEAKPDKLKSQRSVQEVKHNYYNRAEHNAGCVGLILILCLRLFQ